MSWNLEKQAKISSTGSAVKPGNQSLFNAVRQWSNNEGNPSCYVEVDGERLSAEQLEAIAHSESYMDRLLAFNERME